MLARTVPGIFTPTLVSELDKRRFHSGFNLRRKEEIRVETLSEQIFRYDPEKKRQSMH